ncbi:MAG: T9SS type A sorting domain-containing protein [Bacteroidota bacterium]
MKLNDVTFRMIRNTLILILVWFNVNQAFSQDWIPYADGELPISYAVYDVSVVSDQVIWAVAWDATIGNFIPANHTIYVLKTVNGGDNWNAFPVSNALGRISFDIQGFSADTALITTQDFGSGAGRGVFRTVDGGQNWAETLNHPAGGVWIRFFNKNEGVVINRQIMAITSDQGNSWNLVPFGNIPAFGSNEFTLINSGSGGCKVVDDHIWFNTNAGRVFRSKDKGLTWTVDSTGFGPTAFISSIAFKDTLFGIAHESVNSFTSRLAWTEDGGSTWSELTTDLNVGISEIAYVPGSDSTLIGISQASNSSGRSLKSYDFGKTWEQIDVGTYYRAMEFIDGNVGWVTRSFLSFISTPALFEFKNCVDGVIFETNETLCQGPYTWTFNNQVFNQPGSYSEFKTNLNGCDTSYYLNLVPLVVDTTVVRLGASTLVSTNQQATYQWLDCNKGFLPIPGATSATFSPTENGDYAVEVTPLDSAINCQDTSACFSVCFPSSDTIAIMGDTLMAITPNANYQWIDCLNGDSMITGANGQIFIPSSGGEYAVIVSVGSCTDTLACQRITPSNISSHSLQAIKIYPNPAKDKVLLDAGEVAIEGFEIFDLKGQLINSGKLTGLEISVKNVPAGSYFIKLFDQQSQLVSVQHLVKL